MNGEAQNDADRNVLGAIALVRAMTRGEPDDQLGLLHSIPEADRLTVIASLVTLSRGLASSVGESRSTGPVSVDQVLADSAALIRGEHVPGLAAELDEVRAMRTAVELLMLRAGETSGDVFLRHIQSVPPVDRVAALIALTGLWVEAVTSRENLRAEPRAIEDILREIAEQVTAYEVDGDV